MIYYPIKDEIEAATRFADVHDDNYEDCGQTNPEKKRADKLLSKLAEFAVQRACLHAGCRIIRGVDVQVLKHWRRSHAADLVVSRESFVNELSVKLCTSVSAVRYGASWMYQYEPRRDPVFLGLKDNRREVLVMETPDHGFQIVGKFFARELLPVMREPRLEYLRGKKKVVYMTDLPRVAS